MTHAPETDRTASLLIIAPAPVIQRPGGLELDVKFVEGMGVYRDNWNGPIGCLLFEGAGSIPFGRHYVADDLPFSLRVLPEGTAIGADHLDGYDIVFGSADSHMSLHLPDLCRREGRRCVLAIEYTFPTRLDILRLEGRSLPRKVYGGLWLLAAERRRRAAMRRADGLQANGYPAWDAYGALSDNRMLYLDNRMRGDLFATDAEMQSRAERLRAQKPLRLIYSGRLEALKGVQDLVPLAVDLRRGGLDFSLDVFGTGSLEQGLRDDISGQGLGDCVRFHGPVDFETELVPHARAHADIFLSCHRQSDPSCTYIESMGCGLAVAGYDNAMLSRLVGESDAGWCVPLGQPAKLAERLIAANGDRASIAARCSKARDFSARHDFTTEFRRRMDHIASVTQGS